MELVKKLLVKRNSNPVSMIMKKLLVILLLFFPVHNLFGEDDIENRVIGFADSDDLGLWFIYKFDSNEEITLSFAGSGKDAGILIVEGRDLITGDTLCFLDKENELKIVLKKFLLNDGASKKIKVNIKNNLKYRSGLTVVEGTDDYITNGALTFFLKAAQEVSNVKEYLSYIDCKSKKRPEF